MEKQLILFGAQYLYLVTVVLAGVFIYSQSKELRFKLFISLVISFPLAYIVAKIGSVFFDSPRPFVLSGIPSLIPHAADNGFPSDHTLLSAACAALIFWCEKRLGTILLTLAFLVGYSRMLAGVHHLVDILGSIAIATSVAWGVWRYVTPKVYSKFKR